MKQSRLSSSNISDLYLQERLKKDYKIKSTIKKFSEIPFYEKYKKYIDEYFNIPIDILQNGMNNNILSNIRYERTLLITGIQNIGKKFFLKSICREYNIILISEYLSSAKDVRDIFRKAKSINKSIILLENIEMITEHEIIFEINKELEVLEDEKSNNFLMVVGLTTSEAEINKILKKHFNNNILMKLPTKNEKIEILKYLFNDYNIYFKENEVKNIIDHTPGYLIKDYKMLIRKIFFDIHVNSDKKITSETLNIKFYEIFCDKYEKKVTNYNFDNIGGLSNIKNMLNYFVILPAKSPEVFKNFGTIKPSGILLHGPPGCGKTLLAKSLSENLNFNFLSVKGPEFVTKYVGDTEKAIRNIFDKAKNLQPCLIFFDEIDSFCTKRNDSNNRAVNQMLTMMDGLEDRGDVYILGATNRLKSLDKALLRPGRFDKILKVDYPTDEERVDIFNKVVQNKKIEEIDLKKFIELTDNFTGADIAGLVKEATIRTIKNAYEKNGGDVKHFAELKIKENFIYECIEEIKYKKRKIKPRKYKNKIGDIYDE